MPGLILHHYPMSPFSEKVRAVLGFKKLAWQSVLIPTVMPKPYLLARTLAQWADSTLFWAATRTRYTLRRLDARRRGAGALSAHWLCT